MNALLGKVLGKAVQNWRQHVAQVEKSLHVITAAYQPARDYRERLAAAHAEFRENPTTEGCARLIAMQAGLAAAAEVERTLFDTIAAKRSTGLEAGKEKLRAACEETQAGIDARRIALVKEDVARSKETGYPVESTAALAELKRRQERLEDGLMWIDSKLEVARSALQAATGEPGL